MVLLSLSLSLSPSSQMSHEYADQNAREGPVMVLLSLSLSLFSFPNPVMVAYIKKDDKSVAWAALSLSFPARKSFQRLRSKSTVMDTHIKKNFEDVPWSAVSLSIPMRCIDTSIKIATRLANNFTLSVLAKHIYLYISTPQHLA
jgi:hypothetical protein